MLDYFSLVRKIDGRQIYFFLSDIIPDIEFRPVADRKHPYVFAFVYPSIVNIPQFRSLKLGIPLAKLITDGKYSLFGSCFFLVSSPATDTAIEFELFYRIQQCISLQPVSAGKFSFLFCEITLLDGVFYFSHDERGIYFFHQPISELQRFGETVSSIDMHQWERNLSRCKCFFCQ